jgi:hypothetical protein
MHNTGQDLDTVLGETKSFVKKKTLSCVKETPGASSASKYLYKTHYPRTRVLFFPQFCEVCRLVVTNDQEDLAKFGYRSKSKVELIVLKPYWYYVHYPPRQVFFFSPQFC